MSKEACKRPDTSDSLELEMQVVVSQGGGTGNRIQVLFKNVHSQPLNHLSSLKNKVLLSCSQQTFKLNSQTPNTLQVI